MKRVDLLFMYSQKARLPLKTKNRTMAFKMQQ